MAYASTGWTGSAPRLCISVRGNSLSFGGVHSVLAEQRFIIPLCSSRFAECRQFCCDSEMAPSAGMIIGLIIVDITSGDTIAWVRIEGVVRELYDVAFIPGIRNPSAIGFKTDEILRVITIDES
jgi:hypothetical protein